LTISNVKKNNQGYDVDWNIQARYMTETSREKFQEYAQNVLNRSRTYLEDIVECEEVVQV